MNQKYIDDEVFEGENFMENPLPKANYENCEFNNCQFMNSHLNGINFIECSFKNCDLSNVILTETGIRMVHFEVCKLIGLRFDSCSDFLFEATFDNCRLDYCVFEAMNAQKTFFKD